MTEALSILHEAQAEPSVKTKAANAPNITMRPAVPVFKTERTGPSSVSRRRLGYEVVATEDHRFFTPNGPKALSDLRPGDEILLQPGAGVWNKDDLLPPSPPRTSCAPGSN